MSAEALLKKGKGVLTVEESKAVLRAAGIRTNRSSLAGDPEEAARLAEEMGFPVVMKIVSPQIVHKTEAGGVETGINTAEDAARAFTSIVKRAEAYSPEAEIRGVLVEEMAGGVEMIVGAARDPTFGHLIMFGLGGIFVEVFRDVSFRVIPIGERDALDMIDEIRGRAVIDGVRGQRGVSREGIAEVLLAVSGLVERNPQIRELDINPLMGDGDSVVAVDARIVLEGVKGDG